MKMDAEQGALEAKRAVEGEGRKERLMREAVGRIEALEVSELVDVCPYHALDDGVMPSQKLRCLRCLRV